MKIQVVGVSVGVFYELNKFLDKSENFYAGRVSSPTGMTSSEASVPIIEISNCEYQNKTFDLTINVEEEYHNRENKEFKTKRELLNSLFDVLELFPY